MEVKIQAVQGKCQEAFEGVYFNEIFFYNISASGELSDCHLQAITVKWI